MAPKKKAEKKEVKAVKAAPKKKATKKETPPVPEEKKVKDIKRSEFIAAAEDMVKTLILTDDDDNPEIVTKGKPTVKYLKEKLLEANSLVAEGDELQPRTFEILALLVKEQMDNETVEERQARMADEVLKDEEAGKDTPEEEPVEEAQEAQGAPKKKAPKKKATKAVKKEAQEESEHPFHAVANIFPMMTPPEFEELKQDIKENGLRIPVMMHNDRIIDGRNRYLACKELGIPIKTEIWVPEGSLTSYILSLNFHRRQLTVAQKAAIGVEAEKHFAIEAKERQKTGGKAKAKMPEAKKGQAREKAAKKVGVSARTISDAKKIKKENPKDFEDLKSGKKTIPQAKANLPQETPKPKKKTTFNTLVKDIEGNSSFPEFVKEQFLDLAHDIKTDLKNQTPANKKALTSALRTLMNLII